ncbi:hypothetical protein [Bradyrhizobium liaoningense]|uniref:hypothetical protein n=1 Tax=Bradyrhizobium liaoningense TaxID=43992 RepID=UPI001BA7179E|nr:hypothetical protein [Bradyrhizobium liaoningense]MBR1071315.1 hypothetical protein [Bradyrhizobium liaoningense]
MKEISPLSQSANALRLCFAKGLIHRATHTELQFGGFSSPASQPTASHRIHGEADHFGTLASRALEGTLATEPGFKLSTSDSFLSQCVRSWIRVGTTARRSE